MTNILIEYDSFGYTTREADCDDVWDRDSTGASHYISGIKEVNSNDYYHFEVPFKVSRNKNYYLLFADYCTGDSFGTDDNQLELIDLYQTKESAEAAKTIIEVGFKSVKYLRDNGDEIQYSIPWYGYFERLNSLEVKEVSVVKRKRK